MRDAQGYLTSLIIYKSWYPRTENYRKGITTAGGLPWQKNRIALQPDRPAPRIASHLWFLEHALPFPVPDFPADLPENCEAGFRPASRDTDSLRPFPSPAAERGATLNTDPCGEHTAMRKLTAFTNVSLDGYYASPDGRIDWFKNPDEEEREFSAASSQSSGTLIFGRTTYELMASYWPTPAARKNDPAVADVLNTVPKIVFSETMGPVEDGPVWKNVTVRNRIDPGEIKKLKAEAGGGIAILGSGSIVRQFANLGLIDEYSLMVIPVILGAGKPLFRNVAGMRVKLLDFRVFRSGKVFLKYGPA